MKKGKGSNVRTVPCVLLCSSCVPVKVFSNMVFFFSTCDLESVGGALGQMWSSIIILFLFSILFL